MPSSQACFDFLSIVQELSPRLGNSTAGEIHLFAYLACLLSLFKGRPAAEWGYAFAGLDSGSPFSPELQDAHTELERSGYIASAGSGLLLTELGQRQMEVLNSLSMFIVRRPYLSAACSSLLALPVGMIRNAMSMEPSLRPVMTVGGIRPLLATASLEQLYEHFGALFSVVGSTSDLLVPSTVWLTYLLELSRKHDHEFIGRAPG